MTVKIFVFSLVLTASLCYAQNWQEGFRLFDMTPTSKPIKPLVTFKRSAGTLSARLVPSGQRLRATWTLVSDTAV